MNAINGDVGTQRRTTLTLSLVIVLLMIAALIAVLVGSETNRTRPAPLGGLAYLAGGDLYVAGPGGESPRLVWDLPATTTEDTSVGLWWLDTETLLLHSWISPVDGVSVVNVISGSHRLLDTGDVVALSPDRRVVAVHAADLRVRLIEIATGAVVGDIPGMVRGYPAVWSPDGLFFLSESPETIDRTDVATGEITVLASALCCGLSSHHPTWSPDGTRVVYVDYHLPIDFNTDCHDRCGTLWSVPVAVGAPIRITAELGSETLPAFSSDGRWIAYIEENMYGIVQRDDLAVIAADGSGRRLLTPKSEIRTFAWDPDSGGLLYLRFDGSLWHITLDGVAARIGTPAMSEFARQVVP